MLTTAIHYNDLQLYSRAYIVRSTISYYINS